MVAVAVAGAAGLRLRWGLPGAFLEAEAVVEAVVEEGVRLQLPRSPIPPCHLEAAEAAEGVVAEAAAALRFPRPLHAALPLLATSATSALENCQG